MNNERSREDEEKAFWEKAYLNALESLIRAYPSNPANGMRVICSAAETAADFALRSWGAFLTAKIKPAALEKGLAGFV